jgi:hypothetical protein
MPGLGGILVQAVPPGYVDPHQNAAITAQLINFNPLDPVGTVVHTLDRNLITSGAVAALNTTGTVAAHAVGLFTGQVVSNISVLTGGTAAVAPSHLWFGLMDANSNVLAVTADQGGAAQAANTLITLPLVAPVGIGAPGLYYVIVSSSAATTAPSLSGIAQGPASIVPTPALCGTAGVQAAPPAVGATLSAVTANVNMNFAAWLS